MLVIYDACVLYPAPLRDTLMSLAVTRLFRAHWTDEIHDEWTKNLLQDRPDILPEQLARTRSVMDKAVPDALVSGYERLVQTLKLPDPNDRHILAAAIYASAGRIITLNLKDFPRRVLLKYQIEAWHPDAFIAELLEHYPLPAVAALSRQRKRLARPAQSKEEFFATLAPQGLHKTVEILRSRSDF